MGGKRSPTHLGLGSSCKNCDGTAKVCCTKYKTVMTFEIFGMPKVKGVVTFAGWTTL